MATTKTKRANGTAAKTTAAPRKPATPSSALAPGKRAPAFRLASGARAPAFRLASDAGGEVSLADYAGKWVVLYFYPRDSTPGCTREAIAFRDAAKALAKRGAAVLGVSRDSLASHGKFRAAQKLTFPLLSDPDASVHAAYGAYGEKTLYGKKVTGALRTTALIGPDGKIARMFPNVKVDGHVDAVIAAIDELSARE